MARNCASRFKDTSISNHNRVRTCHDFSLPPFFYHSGLIFMHLELLHAAAKGAAKPVKLLFIHGICSGAWVWEPNFLPYFSGVGYESFALSLRGHGKSPGRESVRQLELGDFADDVDRALQHIGGPTAVIGHSLGGAVVQNYVKRGGKAAGIVLFCPVPPHGMF